MHDSINHALTLIQRLEIRESVRVLMATTKGEPLGSIFNSGFRSQRKRTKPTIKDLRGLALPGMSSQGKANDF